MDIIRAWKDPEYRESLSEAELSAMPAHPAGMIELSDADLGGVAGGGEPYPVTVDPYNLNCGPPISQSCTPNLSLKLPCRPVCGSAINQVVDMAILTGVEALDGDFEITDEELTDSQDFAERVEIDPTLTAEEIDGITQAAEALQEDLPPEEWNALMHSVHAIQDAGALTEEQVAELSEFVEMLSEE